MQRLGVALVQRERDANSEGYRGHLHVALAHALAGGEKARGSGDCTDCTMAEEAWAVVCADCARARAPWVRLSAAAALSRGAGAASSSSNSTRGGYYGGSAVGQGSCGPVDLEAFEAGVALVCDAGARAGGSELAVATLECGLAALLRVARHADGARALAERGVLAALAKDRRVLSQGQRHGLAAATRAASHTPQYTVGCAEFGSAGGVLGAGFLSLERRVGPRETGK